MEEQPEFVLDILDLRYLREDVKESVAKQNLRHKFVRYQPGVC